MPRVIEGRLDASGLRFGIVAARFNEFFVAHLISGATDTILRHGGKDEDITIVRVPGSFELAAAAKKLISSVQLDAVIALGVIIRGATSHYDHVCNQAASGLGNLSVEASVPVLFGVVTADTMEQAIERAGTKAGNKGADAALGAIEMAQLYCELSKKRG